LLFAVIDPEKPILPPTLSLNRNLLFLEAQSGRH
jgi:hypothetical protein